MTSLARPGGSPETKTTVGLLLFSALFWLFLAASSAALFPVALLIWLITLPFDPRRRLLHQFTCFWASLYTWLNPLWSVTIADREKLRSESPTVMVANHLSLLDILVLFRIFAHFKWVSKIENFRVPLIGWNMSLNGYIKLRRGDRTSVVRMLKACEATISAGSSLMMFPEGTRSPTGRMREFKSGAFEIALRTRSAVQPILITGTAEALPKKGFVLKGRHRILVKALDPIPPQDFEHLDAAQLSRRVRSLIAAELGKSENVGPDR